MYDIYMYWYMFVIKAELMGYEQSEYMFISGVQILTCFITNIYSHVLMHGKLLYLMYFDHIYQQLKIFSKMQKNLYDSINLKGIYLMVYIQFNCFQKPLTNLLKSCFFKFPWLSETDESMKVCTPLQNMSTLCIVDNSQDYA